MEQLNQECSRVHLRRISNEFPNWLQFADFLGLTPQEINDIRTDLDLTSGQMKSQKMLEKWHQSRGAYATYLDLVNVCLELRCTTIAEKICDISRGQFTKYCRVISKSEMCTYSYCTIAT